ncbi:Sir2 family NAD-dependent protein deacetylase [Leucobacter sp. HY1908]
MSVTASELDRLAHILSSRQAAVLTGAGVSTDSGIPDYRGAGSPPRSPMRIGEFMSDAAYRRRFWAGARVGADRMASLSPNAGHLALARLEMGGQVSGVATQNVDGLHRVAGSRTLVELHGRGDVTRCTRCNRTYARTAVLARFDELNPGYALAHAGAEIAPDGDAAVSAPGGVVVPDCPACGGLLRPDVVYFGEMVPLPVFRAAASLVEHADALILAGTSLAVNTGLRLVHRAERHEIPIIVINRGPTQVDARESITLRIEGGTSEVLEAVAELL